MKRKKVRLFEERRPAWSAIPITADPSKRKKWPKGFKVINSVPYDVHVINNNVVKGKVKKFLKCRDTDIILVYAANNAKSFFIRLTTLAAIKSQSPWIKRKNIYHVYFKITNSKIIEALKSFK